MTAVIVTGGIDVSVGSAAAVVMVVVARLIRDGGAGLPAAVLVAVAIGLVLGAVNGALISFGGIHPIIVTFGTLNLYRFLALRLFENKQVSGVPGTLSFFGGGDSSETLGIPNAWWLTMVAAALMWCYSRYWATGRHWYAIGERRGGRAASPASGSTAGPSRPTPSPGSSWGSPAWCSSAPAASSSRTPGAGSS